MAWSAATSGGRLHGCERTRLTAIQNRFEASLNDGLAHTRLRGKDASLLPLCLARDGNRAPLRPRLSQLPMNRRPSTCRRVARLPEGATRHSTPHVRRVVFTAVGDDPPSGVIHEQPPTPRPEMRTPVPPKGRGEARR